MISKTIRFTLVLALILAGSGCSSWTKAQKGAAIGATSGGVVGGVIGNAAGNTALGAILGAAIGGAAGAYIGSYMDKQAAEIEEDIQGARVERVGEGIKITFDSGILFDVNKSDIKPAVQTELGDLAVILNKYEDTNILLEGHTDNTGSDEYNMTLSQKRAQSVASYLSGKGVNVARVTIMGYGESQPIATNDTPDGRTQNRRVEVAIYANEKLKKVAKDKTQG
ncbi:MAG: OmpA family protein [Calditrichaeota bacterium]|nr:OmpA family protein [Calditrichota bacterium]MCB0302643.1 OmpA family protein [Calditrichota bacterium]